MTIGFDGSRAFVSGRTGTENYSYNLLKALSKIDRKNQYLVYVKSLPSTIYHLPSNFRFKVIYLPRLWTQLGLASRTFIDPIDVLFVPAHTLPIFRKPGLKTVVTVHDLGSEYLPQMHQLKQRAYLSLMQKHQLKGATKIIAVSKATKEDLVKRIGIKPGNVTVIYEGYDKGKFQVPSSKLQIDTLINSLRYYNLKPKTYYLFVGTVQPRKNLERVIKAFSQNTKYQIQNTNLVIVGEKGWMSEEIYKLPKKLGIESRVKFLGYVPDEKLPAFYSNAEALVFPSLFEGFGLPILEAQACGCPVITSNISSMPEVAGKGAIFVDPYSIDDIVEGMRKMEDRRLRVEIIKRGHENVKRFFWEKCAKETLNVLESV